MSGQTHSTRILFVDDSKVMLKTAFKILSAEFDVVTAVDGDDAWAKLEKDHEIQVLFTDINMPGTDGYGLLNKVRTADKPNLHDIPVILVTGADDDESARQQALDRGATDFLSKKLISTELLPRARAHANYQRITRQLQAQSTLDPLTGLSNETGFLSHLEQDIAYERRHAQGLALMCLEVDDLVATFEHRGNAVVEQIVVHVASLIRKRIREEDTAAHIGLGGFAISLPGGHRDGIEAMAAWLHAQTEAQALEIDGKLFPIDLHTSVVFTGPETWSSARDALDRCQALLEHTRHRAAVPTAVVAQPQPVAAVPARAVAASKAPEPVVATATPAPPSLRREPVREQPKVDRAPPVAPRTPSVVQRLMSFVRSAGARTRALLVRFLRKRGGK